MTFLAPLAAVFAVLLGAGAVTAYVLLERSRSKSVYGKGFATRRHLPYAMYLAALPLLLLATARPQAQISVPHIAGTVVLVFDVSKSMSADDVLPSRLAAAQAAATDFVQAQPKTVDIGVVIFGQDGLTTQRPTADHSDVLAAIARMKAAGGTSLTQAILASLGTIIGKPVRLPDENATDEPPPDLGYWGSATILLYSDGQDMAGSTTGVEAAAGLAAAAGVRIETVGVGTTQGTTVEVDGYQVATALNEDLLTMIAATTGGSYHPASDAAALNDVHKSIDLRLSTKPQPVELTALFAGVAILLLTLGGLLMIRWHGRII